MLFFDTNALHIIKIDIHESDKLSSGHLAHAEPWKRRAIYISRDILIFIIIVFVLQGFILRKFMLKMSYFSALNNVYH